MNKTVLITGGSRGIGRACAIEFARLGYKVAFTYKNSYDKAMEVTQAITAFNPNILAIKCDARDNEQTRNAITATVEIFGSIDVLINNVGIAQQKLFTDITPEDWDNMFDVNVKSCYNACYYAVAYMIKKKYGKIINISSIWGMVGASCEVHYCASKAAIIGFTKALAKELGPSGIRVNAISPGVIDTDMNSDLDVEIIETLKEETPLCSLGTPEDIAHVAVFLASEQADFITGQNISPNGGFVI